MAASAVRSVMESYLRMQSIDDITTDLVIITGKGLRSASQPVLLGAVQKFLEREYGVNGKVDDSNEGRLILDAMSLRQFVCRRRLVW
jgi:DNA-nicking Smr family endonuclease